MDNYERKIIEEFGDDIAQLASALIEVREELEKANDRIIELEQEIKDITN